MLGLFLPGLALAVDCNRFLITLSNQTDVNNFQATYGPCDTVADQLQINGNTITDLTPLSDLVRVNGYLAIYNNTTLTSLAGLENLTYIGDRLSIEDNNSLTSLEGLSNLNTLGILYLWNNPGLTNLSGLPAALTSINTIGIMGNNSLTSLEGMPVVAQVNQRVSLAGNGMLTDVSALSSLTFIDQAVPSTSIDIRNNDLLQSLGGFPIGDRVADFGISNNAVLTNIDAASGLVEVWEFLRLSDNPMLSDCTALTTVLDDIDDGDPGPAIPLSPPDSPPLDEIFIGNNLPGCNDIAEIVNPGPGEIIMLDGFEGD